jgi:hypothetical protein
MRAYQYKVLFLMLAFGCFAWNSSFGQVFYEDVVELKDGSKIRGWIVEQIPGEYLKIELLGGSILVYQQSEIKKITKEYSRYKSIRRKINYRRGPILFNDTGLYRAFSLSLMFNEGEWGPRVDPGFQLRAGYRFNQYLALGGGSGVEFYEAGVIVPLFAEINGDLWQKRITPHYLIQAGYGFGVAPTWMAEEFSGGLMGQGGIGFKVHSRRKLELTYMLLFKYQETTDVQAPWGGWDPWGNPINPTTIIRERTFQSLAFQVSVNF